MNYADINEYIYNYIKSDKTNSAIMLTSEWGTGKTYYFNEILKKFLHKQNVNCVYISLYGLKDLFEVSKNIYFEAKFKRFNKETKAKIIGKTILINLTNKCGLNIEINNSDLKKIYNSIDLSGKLLVFDDLDRTEIDILSLLGYINNLVEQDNVKVLLIANENELISKCEFNKKKDEYLRIKEKTISDTINFYPQYDLALKNIINSFNSNILNKLSDDYINEILNEINKIDQNKPLNLRAFKYSCQKAIDLFKKIRFEYSDVFFEEVFLGIIAFSHRFKSNKCKVIEFSYELGTNKYPLHKFAYDYIRYQQFDEDKIKKDYFAFCENLKKNDINNVLNTLYSFSTEKEHVITETINKIYEYLKTNSICTSEYSKLANYLISAKYVLGCNNLIDNCKELMIKNIITNKPIDKEKLIYHSSINLDNKDAISEFKEFKNKLISNSEINDNIINFDYKIENIDSFYNNIYKNKELYIRNRRFALLFDNTKLIDLIKKCSAHQLDLLRGIFISFYSPDIVNIFINDKDSLIDLKKKIENALQSNIYDKIQKLQLSYFVSNLSEIIKNMN